MSLSEWGEDELMSLILNISRYFLAQDACYGCLFQCTIERDMKSMCLSSKHGTIAWMVKIHRVHYFPVVEVYNNWETIEAKTVLYKLDIRKVLEMKKHTLVQLLTCCELSQRLQCWELISKDECTRMMCCYILLAMDQSSIIMWYCLNMKPCVYEVYA